MAVPLAIMCPGADCHQPIRYGSRTIGACVICPWCTGMLECVSDDPFTGYRALTEDEIKALPEEVVIPAARTSILEWELLGEEKPQRPKKSKRWRP